MQTNSRKEAHSESHLNESREYWWNPDFLKLMAERMKLNSCKKVADIGCGQGLMPFLLADMMHREVEVYGIDAEKRYIQRARQKARKAEKNSNRRFIFQEGDAYKLPFEDESMDLVMCQTLLIHLKDPKAALLEMKRVTKKGGMILTMEPNNIAANLMFDTYAQTDFEPEDLLENLEIKLRAEKGKRVLGEGFNSIGEVMPDLMNQMGITDIQIFLSDKCLNLIPPYDTKEKRLRAAQLIDWIENQTGGFGYDHNWRYYQAGGGSKKKFDAYWLKASRYQNHLLSQLKKQEGFLTGGNMMYATFGTVNS